MKGHNLGKESEKAPLKKALKEIRNKHSVSEKGMCQGERTWATALRRESAGWLVRPEQRDGGAERWEAQERK